MRNPELHRFTKQALDLVEAARSAVDDGPRGPERLLLELLRDRLSLAALLLLRAGVDVERIRCDIEEAPRSDPGRAVERLNRVLKLAAVEAARIYVPSVERERLLVKISGIHNPTIATEHLLLGIACEESGIAAALLTCAGADAERLRQNLVPHPATTSLPLPADATPSTSALQYASAACCALQRIPPSIRRRRFTDEARHIFLFAQELAEKAGCDEMRPDHILVAMASAPPTAGSRLLKRMKVDLGRLQKRAAEIWSVEPRGPVEPDTMSLDYNLKAAVNRAYSAARSHSPGPVIMVTLHLLFGVFCHPGEEAAQILAELGLDITAARCALQAFLEAP